jgi:hypothetical protein
VWKTRIAEPKQPGFSCWHGDDKARVAVYANRTRLGSGVGKQAMRRRAEIVERSFAHISTEAACAGPGCADAKMSTNAIWSTSPATISAS